MKIRLLPQPEYSTLSFSDYPNRKVGDALNGLSVDKKCFSAPSDRNPQSDWQWRFRKDFTAAVLQLLLYFDLEVIEDD